MLVLLLKGHSLIVINIVINTRRAAYRQVEAALR